jgi:hypothetical protein
MELKLSPDPLYMKLENQGEPDVKGEIHCQAPADYRVMT